MLVSHRLRSAMLFIYLCSSRLNIKKRYYKQTCQTHSNYIVKYNAVFTSVIRGCRFFSSHCTAIILMQYLFIYVGNIFSKKKKKYRKQNFQRYLPSRFAFNFQQIQNNLKTKTLENRCKTKHKQTLKLSNNSKKKNNNNN